ncbi:MAG: hypothetical protein AAGF50_04645 [Pseudomonadota bacterium]
MTDEAKSAGSCAKRFCARISLMAFLGIAGSPLVADQASAPDPVTFIINRDAHDTEVYVSLPALEIEALLGQTPGLIFSENGTVPIGEFQLAGSTDVADALVEQLQLSAGGSAAGFEAMSLMVHPAAQPQPFMTPWDAVVATAVCTVEDDAAALTIADTRLYFGLFGRGVGGDERLRIDFPDTDREARAYVLREYFEGRFVRETAGYLPDGGQLEVDRISSSVALANPAAVRWFVMSGMAAGLAFGAIWLFGPLRRRSERLS